MFFSIVSSISANPAWQREHETLKFIEVELDPHNRNENFLRQQLIPLGIKGYKNIGNSKIQIKYDTVVYARLRQIMREDNSWIRSMSFV